MTMSVQLQPLDRARFADEAGTRTSRTPMRTPQPALEPSNSAAPPLRTVQAMMDLDGALADALASGDPASLMAMVASRIQRNQNDSAQSELKANHLAKNLHAAERMRAYHEAEKAEQGAKTWGLVARIGAYVAAALAVVVGVATAVFTGGTSLLGGIALAAVCISSAASITVMALQDTRVLSEAPPRWVGITIALIALVGSVCSLGANSASTVAVVGNCVSAAAQAADVTADVAVEVFHVKEPPPAFRYVTAGLSLAGAGAAAAGSIGQGAQGAAAAVNRTAAATARGVQAGAQAARGVALGTQAVGTAGHAVAQYSAETAQTDARSQSKQIDQIDERSHDVLDGMRSVQRSYARMLEQASETAAAIDSARRGMIRNMSRA